MKLIKNSPSVKKSVQPPEGHCEKDVKYKVVPRNGLMVVKFLIMTIQVN